MAVLVSSPKDLEKLIEREEAPELFEYLELGGILRLEVKDGKIVVIYPTKQALREKIRKLEGERKEIIAELAKLRRIEKRGRLLDPLRIKHVIARVFDREYRELDEVLNLDRLLENERGRKIVEQIQRDREYRERVKQALAESPVYKKTGFGDFVERTVEVKDVLLGEREKKLRELLDKVDREIRVLKKISAWAR